MFDDFAAAGEYLINENYTRPGKLAIQGGSNGGLLMGAMITQHPDLFRAVVSSVGIYDMLRVELAPNGAFNVTEFGTVKNPEQFKALYAYSPYHHIIDGTKYPAVLMMTGANDGRVAPYHSRKMTARLIAATRFDIPGQDLWIGANEHDQLAAELAKNFDFCDQDCPEVFRIERGIPRWGCELTGDIIPVEANLEQRCIDYEKGCYIGQETISRMKMSGQRNKQLCGLISLNDSALAPGMKLFPIEGEKKEIGWIASAARSSRLGKEIALGYVKRGFNIQGAKLDGFDPAKALGSAAARMEVVDLPFVQSETI